MLETVIYFVSLAVVIAAAVVAAADRRIWLGPIGSALLCVVAIAAIAMFEHPPNPSLTVWLAAQACLCILSYTRWRRWVGRRDRREGDCAKSKEQC